MNIINQNTELKFNISLSDCLSLTRKEILKTPSNYLKLKNILNTLNNELIIVITVNKVFKGYETESNEDFYSTLQKKLEKKEEEKNKDTNQIAFYALNNMNYLKIKVNVREDNLSNDQASSKRKKLIVDIEDSQQLLSKYFYFGIESLSVMKMLQSQLSNNQRRSTAHKMNFITLKNDLDTALYLEHALRSFIDLSSLVFIPCNKYESIDSLVSSLSTNNLQKKVIVLRNFESIMNVVEKEVSQGENNQSQKNSTLKSMSEKIKYYFEPISSRNSCRFVVITNKRFTSDQVKSMKMTSHLFLNTKDFVLRDQELIHQSILNLAEENKEELNGIQILQNKYFSQFLSGSDQRQKHEMDINELIASIIKIHAKKQLNKNNSNQDEEFNVPEVTWNDVGGLEDAKKEIKETLILTQKYSKFLSPKLGRRAGMLFYGPPGTGKTLLAKCIANECNLKFLSVKGPELLNMYVGESEKNVREIFQKARDNQPSILFFDEIDSLLPKRGNSQDSSSVTDRLVAQFLTEMDLCMNAGTVFIVAATNRPDLVDPSMLQPGRFDVMIYLGVDDNKDSRIKILKAQTRKMNLGVEVDSIEEQMPKGLTGAEIFNYVSKAYKNALEESKKEILDKFRADEIQISRKEVKKYFKSEQGQSMIDIDLKLHHFDSI